MREMTGASVHFALEKELLAILVLQWSTGVAAPIYYITFDSCLHFLLPNFSIYRFGFLLWPSLIAGMSKGLA